MVTVFEQFFHLEYSDSYTCNIHHYCICQSQVTAFETLLALNYNSFILTEAIIGVGIYSIEAGGYYVFDSHARDMYQLTVIVKGHVYCWKYHSCVNQYNIFRLYTGIRIYMNLKVYILPPLNMNIVVYQMLIQ